MFYKSRSHVIRELLAENIHGRYSGERTSARKSLLVQSFKCYHEDEYGSNTLDSPANEEPIYACKFGEGHDYGHILVIADEVGAIGLRDTRTGDNTVPVKAYQIHDKAVMDVCWMPGSKELVSVSGDRRVVLMTVREDGSLPITHVLFGHTRSIKTVSVNRNDPCIIATGARDGNIIIWDKRCKPDHFADRIAPAHHMVPKSGISPTVRKSASSLSATTSSVTSVLFQQQHVLISSGASDGLIKLWDLRKTHGGSRREPQCQSFLEHSGRSSHRGFTSLSLSPEQDVLYASCMDNTIYSYHLAKPTPRPVAEYTGHTSLTYFVKACVSPCGSYLLSGSSDFAAYIWLTDQPGKPIAKLSGHNAEVTAVDWCPVEDKLVTCDDEVKLRIFRRKNVDMDDFDEKLRIRGMSEQYYVEESNVKSSENRKESPLLRERKTSGSVNPLPPHPVTPSTSGIRLLRHATPSEGQSSATPQTCPSTPQQHTPQQHTPQHYTPQHYTPQHPQVRRGKITPCTPKTNERNMLLQWLVNVKTPTTQESPADSSESECGKNTHKRKLTDLMDEDQENVSDKEKPTKSPSKDKSNILGSSSIMNSQTPTSVTAAKMLKYDDSEPASLDKGQDGSSADVADSVHPIDAPDSLISYLRKPVTNSLFRENGTVADESSERIVQGNKQSADSSSHKQFGKFSSPTANLPNYRVDGTSPHSRPEVKIEKKRHTNWLTSISHQRKLKFSKTPDKVIKNRASPRSTDSQKGGV
ncbi:denticleless protein homolog isoform X2 [Eriocheir sinensis]|uniref:denticleless protein homolog isoform X2 n=1 Tax=Eriocheir sinensis TaxID=95602 RepID=UPI0021C5B775|nr:denticleless protein homolog isoform X2 [Eriocheir sinensis]